MPDDILHIMSEKEDVRKPAFKNLAAITSHVVTFSVSSMVGKVHMCK